MLKVINGNNNLNQIVVVQRRILFTYRITRFLLYSWVIDSFIQIFY